jgi:hypothetical protein
VDALVPDYRDQVPAADGRLTKVNLGSAARSMRELQQCYLSDTNSNAGRREQIRDHFADFGSDRRTIYWSVVANRFSIDAPTIEKPRSTAATANRNPLAGRSRSQS